MQIFVGEQPVGGVADQPVAEAVLLLRGQAGGGVGLGAGADAGALDGRNVR